MKIGAKITISFVSVTVGVIVLASIFAYFQEKKALEDRIYAHLRSVLFLKQNQLADEIEERSYNLSNLTTEITNNFDLSILTQEESTTSAEIDKIHSWLTYKLNHNRDFEEIFIIDSLGKVIAATNQYQLGRIKNVSDFIIPNQYIVIQNFLFDPSTHQPISLIAHQINLGDNQVGALVGQIKLNEISEIMIERAGLGDTGETYLVNHFNFLITKSRFIPDIELKKAIQTKQVNDCLAGNSGQMLSEDYRNVLVTAAYQWVPEFNVCIVAEIDASESLKPIYEFLQVRSIYGVFGIFILTFVSLLIARSITKPLAEISKAAEQIGNGTLSYRVKVKSKDELGSLAQSFNQMAERLDLYDKKLNNSLQISNQEQEKIAAILENIGDGVFVVDQARKIILVNKMTQEISGYSRDELMNQPFENILKFELESNENKNDEFIEEVFKTGQRKAMANHTQLITKSGQKISVADSAAPIKDENDVVIACVVVFRDVTKERAIDNMKSEFVSLASHQLRTPLTILRWKAKKLLTKQREGLSQKQIDTAQAFYNSSVHLVRLVNDLLSISRIESGSLQVTLSMVNITQLVQEVIEEISPLIDDKHIKVITKLGEVPTGFFDADLIRQVVVNLLSNAIKYSAASSTIEVISNFDAIGSNKHVKISVIDNGIGIPIEKQPEIFGRFVRAQNAIDSSTDGSGLGLHLAKLIVSRLGGEIGFKSTEDKGSTFWFYVPYAKIE